MGLYQDKGQIGSKPYVSSASYINKMSNYCKHCYYDLNHCLMSMLVHSTLYIGTTFMNTKKTLKSNPHMSMIVSSYERFTEEKKTSIQTQADSIFERPKKGQL